jgi:hypothetical protein
MNVDFCPGTVVCCISNLLFLVLFTFLPTFSVLLLIIHIVNSSVIVSHDI